MRISFPETLASNITRVKTLRVPGEDLLRYGGLASILLLAAVLRFDNLAAIGYANHYYTAAVKSMLQSWHNFFFVAAEPGGSVSVDKPPVGLWLQAISAYLLGVNGFAVVLPQILAGLLSVIVVYHLVRRSFGTAAGLAAALALAITPVAVATDRNNTIDSTLILTLLLAAWAFIKATESKKLHYLVLGAALVGIGFNIKMLAAYLPLPAFYALYFLGSAESLRRKLGKLALASLILVAISFSWTTVVDLTPASQRPYVGSSGNNTELSLIFGYNGVERLLGMFGGRGGFRSGGFPQFLNGLKSFFTLQNGTPNGRQQFGGGNFTGGFGGGGGFGGVDGTGRAGVLRLLSAPLSNEMSWLLPFGLFSALLLLFRARLSWPIAAKHQVLALWGGWLFTGGTFFSIAGFFHPYYLSMLAAPLAILTAIGFIELWHIRANHPWLAISLLMMAAGGTLFFQYVTAAAFMNVVWWLPFALALLFIGAMLSIAEAAHQVVDISSAGFACVLAALLLTPGIWSDLTMLHPSANQSLPAAYNGQTGGPAQQGGLQANQALLDYLERSTQGMAYLMAVPSSMQGADYVLKTGRAVLYLGGFMGQDNVVSANELSDLVAKGELRYIYWDARGGNFEGQPDISTWVRANCTAVQGFNTATVNAGAPDGTANSAGAAPSFGRGGLQVSLYDCGK